MVVFNITILRNNLRYSMCKLVKCENDYPIYPDYCRNKLKYRRFLEEIPEAMAAPKDLNAGFIYIIVAKDLFESPTFQDHCTARGIVIRKIIDPIGPISDSIYEKCLLNTVEYKLGSEWNKVGQYLAEGPDFLSAKENINAIELNIKICDNNAQFNVTPLSLDLSRNLLRRQEDRDFQLPRRVNVLPSLANATMLKRWEAIQEEHPFKDYEDLREYWRKMHGYILPDYEEGLLFYDVEFFSPNEPPTMVYPETCLTLEPYIVSRVNNATGIYERFVENLRERVPTLCGQQLIYPEV